MLVWQYPRKKAIGQSTLTQLSTKHLMSFHIWFSFLVQGILQVHTSDKYSLWQTFLDTEKNHNVMQLFILLSKFNDFQRKLKTENFATYILNRFVINNFFCTWLYWIRNGVVSDIIQLEDYTVRSPRQEGSILDDDANPLTTSTAALESQSAL